MIVAAEKIRWTQVVMVSHCLCPACYAEGERSKLESKKHGRHYECSKCGLRLKAVEIYEEPVELR